MNLISRGLWDLVGWLVGWSYFDLQVESSVCMAMFDFQEVVFGQVCVLGIYEDDIWVMFSVCVAKLIFTYSSV